MVVPNGHDNKQHVARSAAAVSVSGMTPSSAAVRMTEQRWMNDWLSPRHCLILFLLIRVWSQRCRAATATDFIASQAGRKKHFLTSVATGTTGCCGYRRRISAGSQFELLIGESTGSAIFSLVLEHGLLLLSFPVELHRSASLPFERLMRELGSWFMPQIHWIC
jgi:hypothetical protein